jgi:hypothetical protein
MRKINDRIILGLIVGLLADIPKNLLCLTLNKKGITTLKCSDLAASLFIPSYKVTTRKGTLFGLLCDFFVAGINGIMYIQLLVNSGKVNKSNALVKGALSGIFSFGLFRGVITKIGAGNVYPKDILTNIMMGVSSSVWGITAGLLTLLLNRKGLIEPPLASPYVQKVAPMADSSSLT